MGKCTKLRGQDKYRTRQLKTTETNKVAYLNLINFHVSLVLCCLVLCLKKIMLLKIYILHCLVLLNNILF